MRELSPMIGQWPDPEKVVCRNCAFRDKTVVEVDGVSRPVGITRDTCEMFDGTEDCKPNDVLFQNADCPYYLEEI